MSRRRDSTTASSSSGATSCLHPLGVGRHGRGVQGPRAGPGRVSRATSSIKRILPAHGRDPEFIRMFVDEAKILGLLAPPERRPGLRLRRGRRRAVPGARVRRGTVAVAHAAHAARREPQDAARRSSPTSRARSAARSTTFTSLRDETGRPLDAIHRDVTPSNVILTPAGGVKLLDFGVADVQATRVQITKTGTVKGKPAYLAPEQLEGKTDRRARRSVRARHRHARDADAAAPVRGRQRSRHGEEDHGDGDPEPVGASATTCRRRWSGS